jgi:hypothetical protein
MKLRLVLIAVMNFIICFARAQSLSPMVVSTSGAFYQNGSGMLSSTVGEMAMVTTLSSGGSILTQGFQQAFDFGVGIHPPMVNSELVIFPNPTHGTIAVRMPSEFSGGAEVSVFDAIGKLVFKKKYEVISQATTIHLSLEDLIDGMYLLEIKTTAENQFCKINLIR